MPKLSVIVPVFNEVNTIWKILKKIFDAALPMAVHLEVVVVNDGSTDSTGQMIKEFIKANSELEILYFSHDVNRGKGAALSTGISKATGDIIVVQDADLEYDPNEYTVLLKPILDNKADVVYGSRFVSGRAHRVLFFWHSVGNKLLTFLSNMFTNLNLTDMETCYKMWRAEIIKSVDLRENRFGFEAEVTAKVSRINNVRFYEVGVSYFGRTYGEGKKINWKDGFRAIYCILKYNIWSR